MSRVLLGVSLAFLLAAADQLGQCAAEPVDEVQAVLEDEVLEFSLLQRSLSVSRLDVHESLASQVLRRPRNISMVALLERSASRDIIAWPGACVLSLSFAVTLIFVVVLWTAMLEASHASKALAAQGVVRDAGIAGAAARPEGWECGDCGTCCPPGTEQVVEARLPIFGAEKRSAPVPPICPSLSLLQGAAQFRIPTNSLETLRAGYFPMQVLGPSGKALLHAWLPLCSKTPPGSSQPQLGYLLQLTTTAGMSKHPHASIGLLQAGVPNQRTEIFGPKNQKYGSMSRSHDKWLVHHHHEGSEQLALTLHHAAAALGFCAYSVDGKQVATAARVNSPGETLSISVNPGGDAMLALLCILAVVLAMLETVVPGPPEAPQVPAASLPPGYEDATNTTPPAAAPGTATSLPPLPATLPATLPRPSRSGPPSAPPSAPASAPLSAAQLAPRSVPVIREANFAPRAVPRP